MKRPIIWLTILYTAGIVAGSYINLPWWLLSLALGVSLLTTIGGYFAKWPKNSYLIALLIFICGFFYVNTAILKDQTDLTGEAGQVTTLKGNVIGEPIQKTDKVQYLIQLKSRFIDSKEIPTKGKLLLTVKTAEVRFSYGDCIKFGGVLEKPKDAGNPGEFDYNKYLERKGIFLTMRLWDDKQINKLGSGAASPITAAALAAKERFIYVTDNTLPVREAALVKGIIFGVTSGIDNKTQELFRQTGVVHILSVSGLHVALVLAVLLGIGKFCRIPRKSNLILAAVLLVFYGIMTGLGPAIVRSIIMGLIWLLGDFLDRERDWPTTIAISAFINLTIDPLSIFNVGFQLSYIATWAILNIAPWLKERISFMPSWLSNVIAVPLAAQIGTLPLIAYYFNLFTPVSLLANVVAVPLTSLILVLSFAAAMIGLFTISVATFINYSTAALTDLFLLLVRGFSLIPGSVIYTTSPSIPLIILYYTILLLLINSSEIGGLRLKIRRLWQLHKNRLIIGVLVTIALLVWSSLFWADSDKLKVTFIDVGEGDSILVQTPHGQNVLIDTGPGNPQYNAGERVIMPMLRRLGVDRIDILVLTHPHEDHVGGALAIMDAVKVESLVVSPIESDTESYRKVLEKAAQEKINLATGRSGTKIQLDNNIAIDILSPNNLIRGTYSDLNNNSLVLKLKYGKEIFLFTGDIEKEAIDQLMRSGQALQSTVFKLPHHGSKNSLVGDFYKKVNPSFGVITVGKNNFGHPSGQVLKEINRQNIKILRTDGNGAITFATDGQKMNIETFRKGSEDGLSGIAK